MRLYFLRHGLAGDRTDWEGSDDERPLTAKGRQRLQNSAKVMRALKFNVDWVITSPLLRALQTAQIVTQRLKWADLLREDPRLGPGFNPDKLLAILQDYPGATGLMLVGHEPDFSLTVGHIIGGGRVVCKKGSLVRVDLDDPLSLRGELVWMIPPKAMDQ